MLYLIIILFIYLIAFFSIIYPLVYSKIKITSKGINVSIPINNQRLYRLLKENNFLYPEMKNLLLSEDHNVYITGSNTTHKISINNNKIYVATPNTNNIFLFSLYNLEGFIISEYLKKFFNNNVNYNMKAELIELNLIRINPLITLILFILASIIYNI